MEPKKRKGLLAFTSITLILLLVFVMRYLLAFYAFAHAEETYLKGKYKENKDAFASVKNELLHLLEQENTDEIQLFLSYDSQRKPFLHHFGDMDSVVPIDADSEAFRLVKESFGDLAWNKIYISENYINLAEDGNNYQFVYSKDETPRKKIYGGRDKINIRKLGDGWYLVLP